MKHKILLPLLATMAVVIGTTALTGDQTVLTLDFQDRSAKDPAATQEGFESFVIGSSTVNKATITNATTRSYGNITVTLYDAMGLGYDDRQRKIPSGPALSTTKLYQDAVFPRGKGTTNSLNLLIEGLAPGQVYHCTIWSFDAGSLSNRVSDWLANEKIVKQKYTFNGAVLPESDKDYCFEFDAPADAMGELMIQGRRNPASINEEGKADLGVFLNALKIVKAESKLASAQKADAAQKNKTRR